MRPTAATDLVADLNELVLPQGHRADGFFSHAFFEHLRRDARVAHLSAARKALNQGGFVCYLGLPDFEQVARLYLERGPGVVGPVFDLFNVYRYTHGDPDRVGEGYYEQLHKSLFDAGELDRLLTESGFPAYTVFSYVFPGERVAVSLGFYAVNATRPAAELKRAGLDYVAGFDGDWIDASTIAFIDGRTRSAVGASLRARAASSTTRRALGRIALRLAARLDPG